MIALIDKVTVFMRGMIELALRHLVPGETGMKYCTCTLYEMRVQEEDEN